MASDHRDALEKIMRICMKVKQYSRKTATINEIAMRALGMTFGQRTEMHDKARLAADEITRKLIDRRTKKYAERENKQQSEP